MKPHILIWSNDPYEQYIDEFEHAADRDARFHEIKSFARYAVCADVVTQATRARESALTAVDQ
jgi:hypothetical protein